MGDGLLLSPITSLLRCDDGLLTVWFKNLRSKMKKWKKHAVANAAAFAIWDYLIYLQRFNNGRKEKTLFKR